jgi:hypothetical protein
VLKCSYEFLGKLYALACRLPEIKPYSRCFKKENTDANKEINMLERYRTMKNSLFKRAVAAAAAVPLALTQCVTCSFAAEEADDVAVIATAEDAASSKSFTMDKILYIAPDKTESEWNLTVKTAIDELYNEGKGSGSFSAQELFKSVIKNARSYKDLAEAALSNVNDPEYTISADGDITVTIDIDNISESLSDKFLYSLGRLNQKLVDKYGDDSLLNIDYSSIDAGGRFTIVIGTSALEEGKTVEANIRFVDSEGNVYGTYDEIMQHIVDVFDSYSFAATTAINNSALLTDDQKAAACQDVYDNIGKYYRFVNAISTNVEKFLNYSHTALSVSEFVADFDAFAGRYTKRDLPESVTEAVSIGIVKKLFADAVGQINDAAEPYTFDITLDDIASFADNELKNVEIGSKWGLMKAYGEFADAEANEVAEYVNSQSTVEGSEYFGKEYVSSYKILRTSLDASNIDDETSLTASAFFDVTRVIVTKDKEIEETTTTTTTTTIVTDTDETTTTTTTTDGEETTTTTTTTDGEETTTTTTTTTDVIDTTTTTTVTAVKNVYVDYEADYGFYSDQDDEFSADQVQNFEVIVEYDQYYTTEAGMKVSTGTTEPVIIKNAKFGFASTPAETYTAETFYHDMALVATEDIKDQFGNVLVKAGEGFIKSNGDAANVPVYVGLKGDTNLDNRITSVDASYILIYYADMQVDGNTPATLKLSLQSELVDDANGIYDNFAAFLGDIDTKIAADDAWSVGKTGRRDESVRSLTATDASQILVFVSIIADGTTSNADAWAQIIK